MEKRELAELLRQERLTTKQDLLEWIEEAKQHMAEKAMKDKRHSSAYHHMYNKLIENLGAQIRGMRLFERLEDFWYYSIHLSSGGAILTLNYASECQPSSNGGVTIRDTEGHYLLAVVQTHYLPVSTYAQIYGVTEGTVRQWIRRGKIRSAIKSGKEWLIPELCELPGRGYQSGGFTWRPRLDNLPEEFEFLNSYTTAIFNQDNSDKNLFHVTFAGGRHGSIKTVDCDTQEREKLELFLIAHPDVKEIEGPGDGFNTDLSIKHYFGIDI